MGTTAKRGKMGRPRLLDDPVKIAFWLERDDFEKAKVAATRKGVTVSEVVRAAIASLANEKPNRRKGGRS